MRALQIGGVFRRAKQAFYFRWRPFLNDADDEMVVEVALAGSCTHIVSFNERDLRPAHSLNLQVVRPGEFLRLLDAPDQTP